MHARGVVCDLPASTPCMAHGADGVALHKHIAVCQNFDRPKCVAIRPNKALTPFNEALLVPDETTDFDHVALHVVVEDFKGLLNGD